MEAAPVARPEPPDATHAVAIVLLYLVVQQSVGAIAGVVVGVHLGITGRSDPESLQASLVFAVPVITLMAMVASGLASYRVLAQLFGGSPWNGAWAAIGGRPASAGALVLGTVLGACIAGVYVLVLAPLWPVDVSENPSPLARMVTEGGWPLHVWAATAVLVAPVVEEMLFRGALFSGLSPRMGVLGAAVITSGAFLVLHAGQAGTDIAAWSALTTLSAALIVVRIKTGSLVVPIAMHFVYNIGIALGIYAALPS